ncbi:hypothetical protein [Ochrobactrum sp. Marseille-Q0166]|uniref:hypothetical protein n=1 Tax=Ochrobactrum sp. Marseille-Q0166 TaxID=2761105 RepID=UPI0016556AE5|nr:hypothetical protein [Ochrobactrum sp. Marseille-Q0166]MBC8716141.1 hypothetical protein [Ochrobactrum sp. Marseille-Q0166]
MNLIFKAVQAAFFLAIASNSHSKPSIEESLGRTGVYLVVRENFKANKALLCAVFLIPFIVGAVSFYLDGILDLRGTFRDLTVIASAILLLIASLQALNSDALLNGHKLPSRGLLFVGVLLLPFAQLLYLLRTRKPLRAIWLLILFWITMFLSLFAGALTCLIIVLIVNQF